MRCPPVACCSFVYLHVTSQLPTCTQHLCTRSYPSSDKNLTGTLLLCLIAKLPSPPSRSFPPRCRLAIWVIFSTSRVWLLQHLRLCNTSISSSSPPFITSQSLLGAFGDSVLRLLKDARRHCVVHPATYNLCQVHTYLLYLCHHLSTTQRHGSSLCKRLPSSSWPLPI